MSTTDSKKTLRAGTRILTLAGALSFALASTATADYFIAGTRCLGRGFAATYNMMRVVNTSSSTQGVICPLGDPTEEIVEVKVKDASTTGAVTCSVQVGSFYDPGHVAVASKSTGVESLSPSSLSMLRWTASELPKLSGIYAVHYQLSCTIPPASSNGSSYIETIRVDE